MSSEENTTEDSKDSKGSDAPPLGYSADLTEVLGKKQEVPGKKRGRPPKAKSEGAVHGKKGEAGLGRSKAAAGKRGASPAPPDEAPAAKKSAKAPVHPPAPSSAPAAHVRTTKDILYDLLKLDSAEALHELEMEEAQLTKKLAYIQAYKNALQNIPSSEVKDASS